MKKYEDIILFLISFVGYKVIFSQWYCFKDCKVLFVNVIDGVKGGRKGEIYFIFQDLGGWVIRVLSVFKFCIVRKSREKVFMLFKNFKIKFLEVQQFFRFIEYSFYFFLSGFKGNFQ